MTDALAKLDQAVAMLAAASTLEEVSQIRSMASAAEEYARASKKGAEAEGYARGIRIRAARKGGELLKQMRENGERMMPQDAGRPKLAPPVELDTKPTLADLGVTRKQSAVWQKIATVPSEEFEEKVAAGWGENAIAEGEVRPRGGPHYPMAVGPPRPNGVPLGNSKRSGLKPSVRLQKLADQLGAMAAGLPNLDLRGEDCTAQLAEMDKHLADIRRAIRHLQGRN